VAGAVGPGGEEARVPDAVAGPRGRVGALPAVLLVAEPPLVLHEVDEEVDGRVEGRLRVVGLPEAVDLTGDVREDPEGLPAPLPGAPVSGVLGVMEGSDLGRETLDGLRQGEPGRDPLEDLSAGGDLDALAGDLAGVLRPDLLPLLVDRERSARRRLQRLPEDPRRELVGAAEARGGENLEEGREERRARGVVRLGPCLVEGLRLADLRLGPEPLGDLLVELGDRSRAEVVPGQPRRAAGAERAEGPRPRRVQRARLPYLRT